MRSRVSALLAALGLLTAGGAAAQTSADVTATITIPQVLFISVDNTSVTFNQPTAADFNAGSIAANNATVVTHRGNIVHDVDIQTAATNMTAASGDPTHVKPATDLQWSTDGSTWTGVSTTAAKVVDDAPRGSGNVTVQYRMLLDYATDAPDTYSLTFTYTVIAG